MSAPQRRQHFVGTAHASAADLRGHFGRGSVLPVCTDPKYREARRSPRLPLVARDWSSTHANLPQMSDEEAHLRRLKEAETVVAAHFDDEEVARRHSQAYRTVAGCELWVTYLQGRSELIALAAATDELDSGFYNLASGHYREAYGNLRLSLELRMAAVRFSVDELASRQWQNDRSDILWSFLVKDSDAEKPLFTTAFVAEFNDDMGGRWTQYRTIANRVHRELSTHVHGAASTKRTSRDLKFDRASALDWFDKCENADLAAQYLTLARYTDALSTMKSTLDQPFLEMLKRTFAGINECVATLQELGAL